MSAESGDHLDFFLSYTQADRAWAECLAWWIEEAGYTLLIQEWDFVTGSNWAVRMNHGITNAERTIAVLSDDYLASVFGRTEWQGAYRRDPDGFRRKLIPVRTENCDRPGEAGGGSGLPPDLGDRDGDGSDDGRTGTTSSVADSTTPDDQVLTDCQGGRTDSSPLLPGAEAEATGGLRFGDTVGYDVSVSADDWTSISAGGVVDGQVPSGHVLYLLGMADPTPDDDPPGQTPGTGRYFLAQPIEPDADDCWSYVRQRVGYQGFCGATSIFTIALLPEASVVALAEEQSQPPVSEHWFPPERMPPPDVLKLATFEVPSSPACPDG